MKAISEQVSSTGVSALSKSIGRGSARLVESLRFQRCISGSVKSMAINFGRLVSLGINGGSGDYGIDSPGFHQCRCHDPMGNFTGMNSVKDQQRCKLRKAFV